MTASAQFAGTLHVGMGQILLGEAPSVLVSVLGSCVGVALYDPVRRCGALAHIVLPRAEGRTAAPGKFADTAVPAAIEQLEAAGASRRRLQAQLAGGAAMFASNGPLHIGEANLNAVVAALAEAGIPVVGRHVGGRQGRRIRFATDTGAATVQVAGATHPSVTLAALPSIHSALEHEINMKTLLIADDAPIIRLLIRDAAEAEGWHVVAEAANGREAAERYAEHRPDAVTLDLVMPEYDGLYALRAIRGQDPHAQVVVVSALNQKQVLTEAFRAGAADFLVKPFETERLVNTLRQLQFGAPLAPQN